MTNKGPYIQSIQRAVAIMRAFSERKPELSVMELSRQLQLHKSTVSRMLGTLQHEGLISQNPETGKYRLGVGLVSLAGVALGRQNARAAAQPYLSELVDLTQETVNVSVRDGRECINIERAFSPQPIRYMGWIGRRAPLHCTASGQVLLAYMAPAERRALLPQPLPKFTTHTKTSLEELDLVFTRILAQEYVIVQEEYEEGFTAIAAPIYDHKGRVEATLTISGPTYRLDNERCRRFVPHLLETAARISADLGYHARD